MNQRALNSADHPSIANESISDAEIEEQAYRIIDSHQHFHRRADRFVFECEDGVLSVRGCVPSFYLKQVLQNTLQLVPGVRAVDNRVTVVSGHGMSSTSAD
jgi:osmotically-inducible protein OsmY